MKRRPSISRAGSALRKLLTVLAGLALFLILVSLLAIWAVGRFAPRLLDASLSSRSGAHLAVESNASNLFAGRIAFSGLTLTNPSRWQEREFLRVRQLTLDIDTLSFFGEGASHVREAILDVDRLTLVGKANFLTDNNAKDIANGMKGVEETKPKAPAGPAEVMRPYRINHLRVRVDHITVIAGDGTPDRRVVLDSPFNYVFEARDITDQNFEDKVSGPMGKLALQRAIEQSPLLILEMARESLRKPATEESLGVK